MKKETKNQKTRKKRKNHAKKKRKTQLRRVNGPAQRHAHAGGAELSS
jgi:hypothetical protein